jgi:hypothetical protein
MDLAMDGSAAETPFTSGSARQDATRDEWVAVLCRYFACWGLADTLLARAAAERVMNAVSQPARVAPVDALHVAAQWVRAFADEGGEGSDWFFRAPVLLGRFPASFLETDVPVPAQGDCVDLLPELSPRAMPEQEIIGPLTHAVRAAAQAMEGASAGVERTLR